MKISQEPDETIRVVADFCHLFSSQFTANRVGNSKWALRNVLAERNHPTMVFSEYGFELLCRLLGLPGVTYVTLSRDHISLHFNPKNSADALIRQTQILAVLQSSGSNEEPDSRQHDDLSASDSHV